MRVLFVIFLTFALINCALCRPQLDGLLGTVKTVTELPQKLGKLDVGAIVLNGLSSPATANIVDTLTDAVKDPVKLLKYIRALNIIISIYKQYAPKEQCKQECRPECNK